MEERLLERLFQILEEERSCFKQLIELAEKKRDNLINNDVTSLSQVLSNDQEVIQQIEKLEEERNRVVHQLGELYALAASEHEINYSFLIKYLPENWQQRFSVLRQELLDVVENLHNLNEQNKALLEEAIRLNNFNLNTILKALEPDSQIYSRQKGKDSNSLTHLVDRKG